MQYKKCNIKSTVVFGISFLSAFNPVFFCTFAALLITARVPVFERQALNVLLVAAVYTLPLLFTGLLSQYINTRFSVRNVVLFSKAGEIITSLLGCLAVAGCDFTGAWLLLAAVFLFGFDFSTYRPAMKIYIAANAEKSTLSNLSGVSECATFFGIVTGTAAAAAGSGLDLHPLHAPAITAVMAFISMFIASHLDTVPSFRRRLRLRELPKQWLDTLKVQPRYRELVLTGISESYIFASIILTASMAIQYITLHFGGNIRPVHMYMIMAAPVIGAGMGCLAGGKLSKNNIEIGLVPPAALSMSISALLIGTLPYYSDVYIESGLLAALLALFGFSAGIMLVPMQAYQTYFVKRELAPAFFSWFYFPFGIGILLAIALSFLMLYTYAEKSIPIFPVTLILAVLTLLLGAVTFYLMPQFLLRMLMKLLSCTFYRIRTFNAERIPEDGPALLVANRASFVDILFISACTSRPIRFMMHERFYNVPFLRRLYRSIGFISVSSTRPKQLVRTLEATRDLLRHGELVCIFPEEDITKNGTMSKFRDGMDELLPPELDVPIIPVRIGMTWGSIFSCYYGKFKLRRPSELPHPATVTVGNPIPRNTSAYQMRIIMSELAAETELIPGPEERPFHSQFVRLAKKHPFSRRIQQFDGSELQRPADFSLMMRSILISRYLRTVCAPDEKYIGMMLPNSVTAFCVIQGILMADRTPAIMNFTASKEANDHAMKLAGIKHIITSKAFIEKARIERRDEMVFLEDAVPEIGKLSRRIIWGAAALFLTHSELMRMVAPASWNDVNKEAVLIFSSGSTGIPKGIMLTHHNITADVHAVATLIAWSKKDKILGNLPIFHSFGLTVCMWMPVINGGTTVFIANPLDGVLATRTLREQKITLLVATPGFLSVYMRRGAPEDFASVRLTISGAEKLRDDIADRFKAMTNLTIAEGYGCTELSPVVSLNVANSRLELGVSVAARGSIGTPLPGVCVKIVDPSTFALLGENTDGLLLVKGAIVMKGYLNEPEKTAEVIRDGWYVTGDIAKMDRNGFITITGRLSRFSKIAGEMVPHELVEREINNILQPEDRLVAICGALDARRGEKLMVFYTDRGRLAPELLVKRLRERQIPNLWIPKIENFIYIESLPLLGSGKLDFAALKKLADRYSE